ncbi:MULTISPECIES: hypothetical protein [unclassified Rhizobium]|uniref:hypothetical protein n=1 Tax=unclassified Rhizobium TaxID=2613769 RepID=UPI000CDF41B2|nr:MULTISPECIES: hypothetical protein [Rhizobium]AVA20880.1 hypothetical protein NXC24_CH01215 [Rhizobium sp. NXC24]MDK4739024.1 hypothetical protein [Rhizobium sp. CNPSo 3464]UWU23240.1 hypothetical protein N2601_03665 [Rhizobium tropici]
MSFDGGSTVGRQGSEGGVIVLDEEHSAGARITLERCDRVPFAITCGLYGNMVHTVFIGSEQEGLDTFHVIKTNLEELIAIWPENDAPADQVSRFYVAISDFVQRF